MKEVRDYSSLSAATLGSKVFNTCLNNNNDDTNDDNNNNNNNKSI